VNALTSLTVTRDNTKVVAESIEKILEEASDFYAELYRRKIDNDNVLSNECETFLKSNVDKTLTEDFRSLCN
jgi:predicted DNA-binding protein